MAGQNHAGFLSGYLFSQGESFESYCAIRDTYVVDRNLHNDPVNILDPKDQTMLIAQTAIGAASAVIGGPTATSFVGNSGRQFAIEFGKQSAFYLPKMLGKVFASELLEELAIGSLRNSAAALTSSYLSRLAEFFRQRPTTKPIFKPGKLKPQIE